MRSRHSALVALTAVTATWSGSVVAASPGYTTIGTAVATRAADADCTSLTTAEAARERYPVQTTDRLEIVYVDGCALDMVWNDKGSKKDRDLSFWKPKQVVLDAFPGFTYPGEMPLVEVSEGTGYRLDDDPGRHATFLVKPAAGSESSVVRPTDYTHVWQDSRSGADRDVTLWEPNCPTGYDALGLHARAGYPRSSANARFDTPIACFSRTLTHPMEPLREPTSGEPEQALWSSKDTDAADVGIFGVQRPLTSRSDRPNSILVPPATFWARKGGYEPPQLSKFRGLRLPIEPVTLQSKAAAGPRLANPTTEGWEETNPPTTGGYPVSAFLVNDDYYPSDLAKLLDSPVYWIQRTTQWKPMDEGRYCRSESVTECQYSAGITKSESESDTWNRTLGGSVSVEVSTQTEVKPLGVGAGLTWTLGFEASYSHEKGGESTVGSDQSREVSDTITPPTFAAYFQSTSTYRVYRFGDQNLNEDNLVRTYTSADGPIDLVTMPLLDETPTAAADDCSESPTRDLELCGVPTTSIPDLPVATPIYNATDDHYLLLGAGGSLEVRSAESGIEQDGYVWSLDGAHEHGRYGHPITKVAFADGQLVVSAAGLEDWKSSAKPYPGATLEIDTAGNLRIVQQRGKRIQVIWNSKFDTPKAA